MNELKIVKILVGELLPYRNNTRKHTDSDVAKIAECIQADGFNDPIGVWGEKNLIVEGHGRWMAAKKLGMETVPCIRLDHLTEDQRREYAIRHNRSAELATYDFQMLEEEVAALEMEGVDLSGMDFQFDRKYDGDMELNGDGAEEYGEEEFGDDRFQCTCPECGFRFNEK